jgi:murein DD-endopeptidase MepM/ murein hydrolase activator NlpD
MFKKLIIGLSVILAIGAVIIILITKIFNSPADNPPDFDITPKEPPKVEYGIIVDSLTLERGIVRRDQSFSDILQSFGVNLEVINVLSIKSRQVFDLRKLRAGNNYAVILTKRVIPEALYFIYEEDPSSYIIYGLNDPVEVTRGEKPVETRISMVSGTIRTSLWDAMTERGTDPNLANTLSEVYAWTIDFFGIQRGDYYKVIYEEMLVEGKPIGLGNVLAACFNHMGNNFYAFRFAQKGGAGYFDERAESLQRAFLKAPLRFKRISSRFSYSRFHPILKIYRPHTGVDYAADAGTPVETVGDGIIIEKGWNPKGGGNYIKVRHNGTYSTQYMHLSGFARGIRQGVRVRQGDVIGYVGSTGLSTGPHLDFRFYRNGMPVDPLKVESPPTEPVDTANRKAFYKIRNDMIKQLDSIAVINLR